MNNKMTIITIVVKKRTKGLWERTAKKQGLSLTKWAIEKLNSDIEFTIKKYIPPNEIEFENRYFIKLLVPMEYKNYWVRTANKKGLKLRVWAFSKLDENII